jgi:hypothetical protein
MSRPRRILLLARHFPPIGGAGVHRSVGSVRYLPAHGYEPVVVTGPADRASRWSPHDTALLEAIPPGTELHRLEGPEPQDLRDGWRGRADRWLQRPAPGVRWWIEHAVETGIRAGKDADLVYASCVPYATAEVGARVAAALGVPWVADLEDPWALDEMRVQPTALHQRVDFARMRRALSSAAAIMMCAPEAAVRMRAAMPGKRVDAVPIGFESAAFRGPAPARDESVFRIVHTGSMHTDLGLAHRRSRSLRRALRGTSLDVDILTRSHVFLIEALERLLRERPELHGRIELQLAGGLTEGDRTAAAGHDFVRDAGLLSHPETVALMRSASLLFLPMHDLPAGSRAGLIPYKTFEYLAARRPILAAVPEGDVRDLLTLLDDATVCRPDDVAAMAAAVGLAIDRGPVAEVAHTFDTPPLAELERSRCVARIAAVLDAVLGGPAPAARHAA